MRKNKVTQKDILSLSISMFILVVAWIGFNIYHTFATSTISTDLQMQITPISPNFDTDTIHKLKQRTKIDPLFESTQASPSAPINPTPIIKEVSPTPPLEITPTEIVPTEVLPTEITPTP